MPTCKPLRQWLAELPDAAQLAVDPGHGWNEPTRIAGAIVRARPAALCDEVVEALGTGEGDEGWAQAWLGAAAAAERAIAGELDGLEEPTEPGLHRVLAGAYADGDLVYTASSMPIRDQEAFLPSSGADVLFLANRGANGIDGLISSGIGAAAASRRPAWILTGDLGLFHDMNALASVREADVPVRLVVINNQGGGIFEFLPQAEQVEREEFEALLGTPVAFEPEHAARLHGLDYVRLESLEQLGQVGEDPVVVEVRTDRAANLALHRRLTEAATAALSAGQ
jgi:2-succinyl-5-enolpyruvyl-6-hydroxy-3-cyclohexene-1-carboxylate synthase